ncbi:MAG: hypothetical protein WC551_09155 [Patescibacteria group bacterium]
MWKPLQRILDVNHLQTQLSTLKTREHDLHVTVQALTNTLTGLEETDSAHYIGSKYRTYDSQVTELAKKYDGTADWGALTAKNIIDVRTAFITGTGVVAKVREGFDGDAKRELEFIRRFMRFNEIDGKKPQLWGTEAEIEGKVLLRLKPVIDPIDSGGNIRVIHTPWRYYKYEILPNEPDFDHFIRAYYAGSATVAASQIPGASTTPPITAFNLTEPYFVYARFGGNPYKVNLTPPKTAFVLRHVEDLDKELWDWRKINHLFAAPTPWFNCEDPDVARQLNEHITQKNWRIGKAIVTAHTEFDLVCAKGEGYESIRKAIESDIQVISGTTGVPVHFLGHPELLSNRSTADTLLQLIELSTDKERDIWEATYTELFRKSMVMFNDSFSNNLDPDAIVAHLPVTSTANLVFVEKVYLPMYLAGALSLETLLSYLTDVNLPAEVERVKVAQEEKEEKEAAKTEAAVKLATEQKNATVAQS